MMGTLGSPAGGRFRVGARHVCAAILCAVWSGTAWFVPGTSVAAQDRKTVWDKVYTEDQATRGKTEYETHCVGCHVKDLSGRDGGGEGPQLAGSAFTKKWDLQNLNQLYTEIKQRMPRDQPGTLSDDAYLSIVTYILQSNKYPAGEEPLSAEAGSLANIFIAPQAGKASAPQPITTGNLVQVVGCLESAAGGWALTQITPPVRTENPDASPANQLSKLAALPAGSGTIRLLGIYSSLDEHKGHRMEGKGFIVKDPDGDRLNVVSLEMVAASCGK
jgi:mono/diheme cytochrome c family protein